MANTTCGNCDKAFPRRDRGYQRYSLDNKLPRSNVTAIQALETLTSSTFTPIKSKRMGQFLCSTCWLDLSNAYCYKESSRKFWGTTIKTGYIGKKITHDTPQDEDMQPTTSTPLPKTSSPEVRKSLFPSAVSAIKVTKQAKWETIMKNIRKRHYKKAIKGLYIATKGSKRQFHVFIKSIIRAEVRKVVASDIPICRKPSMANIEEFSWRETMEQLHEIAPLLSDVFKSIVTSPQNELTLERGKKRRINLRPYIGNALACLLHARNPNKICMMQTLFSVQFWQGGLKRETIDQISRTGVCLGYQSTRAAIDNLRKGFDTAAKACKDELELQLRKGNLSSPEVSQFDGDLSECLANSRNIDSEQNELSDTEQDELLSQSSSANDVYSTDAESEENESEQDDGSEESDQSSEHEQVSPEMSMECDTEYQKTSEYMVDTDAEQKDDNNSDLVLHPGFTLCWDNVGKKVTTRHPTSTTNNVYVNVALAYLTMNRVPSTHLNSTHESVTTATNIPKETFIAGEEDFREIQNRMCVIVPRILTRHMQWFKSNFSDCVIQHLLHDHSTESSQRSVLVNLGVFDENPSSTQGAIGIYENLLRYVPNIDEAPFPTVVFGDGLSCERGNDAAKARCNGLNPWERLEGLEPAAQEFHKEMILLQDHFDEFFKGSSAAERGTLYFLKNLCNFRQVKADIGENVSNSWELMQTTTEAFVVLLAMQQLEMNGKDDIPPSAPRDIANSSLQDRKDYLESVTQSLVRFLWHDVNTNSLRVEDEGAAQIYCCDDDEKDEGFIGCESRCNCINGEWFHYSCANVDPENLPDEYYCSDECKQKLSETFQFCYCKQDLGPDVPMIGCSAEDRCTSKEWYHYHCVGITEDTVPQGNWYCSEACENISKKKMKKRQKVSHKQPSKDHVYLYSAAMAWSGLNLLCRRDAVREGDGDAMISHWLVDLIQFFRKRHVKYVILAHRLIASVNGYAPENIRQDLRWNRTVNYSGGIGRNLPADLTNEFLNRMFKDLLKDAHGHYTPQTLARCSQIIGPFREALDVVFDAQVAEKQVYRHRRRNVKTDSNVSRIVDVLSEEYLFRLTPGRQHRSFPEFNHTEDPVRPGGFLPKMRLLSEKLDRKRNIVLNEVVN